MDDINLLYSDYNGCNNLESLSSPYRKNEEDKIINLIKEYSDTAKKLSSIISELDLKQDDNLLDSINEMIIEKKQAKTFWNAFVEKNRDLDFKRSYELYGSIVDVDKDNRRFVTLMSSDVDSNKRSVWFSFDEVSESDISKINIDRKIVFSSIKEFFSGEQRNVFKLYFLDDMPLSRNQIKNISEEANEIFKRITTHDFSRKSGRKKR